MVSPVERVEKSDRMAVRTIRKQDSSRTKPGQERDVSDQTDAMQRGGRRRRPPYNIKEFKNLALHPEDLWFLPAGRSIQEWPPRFSRRFFPGFLNQGDGESEQERAPAQALSSG